MTAMTMIGIAATKNEIEGSKLHTELNPDWPFPIPLTTPIQVSHAVLTIAPHAASIIPTVAKEMPSMSGVLFTVYQ